MSISRKDVQHIARLARIELSAAEKAKFEKELSAILDFVAKLNEVDTSGVEPLTGGTELMNVMRDDQVIGDRGQVIGDRGRVTGEELVEAAPRKRNGYVEVKAVFERE